MKAQASIAIILILIVAIIAGEFFLNGFGTEKNQSQVQTPSVNTNSSTQSTQNNTQQNVQPAQQPPTPTVEQNTQLVDYALQLINQDRIQNGLSPVSLSSNIAAQIQADDVLFTKQISHWTTDGEKPYMLYTKYGGTGYVQQNVAVGGYTNATPCLQLFVSCQTIDTMQEIKSLEYQMVYNDSAENWGHRDNILNPYHTNVSIGIAYNKYFFAIVQNFENDYIQMKTPITTDGQHIAISGNLSQGNIVEILVYYDPYPTPELYQQHATDHNYTLGTLLGGVPEPDTTFTDHSLVNIHPNVWIPINDPVANVSFNMAQLETISGVYTVVTWLHAKDYFPVTSYSVFVQ